MEYRINAAGSIDPGAIEDAIRAVDPAAMVDLDPTGQVLRVATSLGDAGLVALLAGAGYPLSPQQLEHVPSQCCGGCSG